MKKAIVYSILIIILISCKEDVKPLIPKKINGYHIIGNLKHFENKTVYLQSQSIDKTFDTLQETKIKENTFHFTGTSTNPKLLYLGFENSDYKIPIIANNFETIVNIDITDLDNTKILGSKLQLDYNIYLNNFKTAKNKFVYQLNYIKSNSNSFSSILVLEQMLGKTKWRLGQNRKAYNYLSASNKKTELAKNILDFLTKNETLVKDEKIVAELSLNPEIENSIPVKAVFKQAPLVEKKSKIKKLPKRKKAVNFYAESINGKDISLNQVKKDATVTLIDFWASWCGPCRKSNPHLIQLYNKYHKKGFNIISVSEDKYKDINKWKNAVATDGLIWNQVIDDNNRIANMFNVKGIPHTVLLDRNGGIISVKNSTYTIEQKLKEIFGF